MSAVEYNSLIFEISQRLDELNVGKKLIVMCRGKVAPRSEGNMQDAFSLFVELEGKEFLGPDNLDVLKDLLKGVKEWALLEEAEKFESKRKEYDVLLKKIRDLKIRRRRMSTTASGSWKYLPAHFR